MSIRSRLANILLRDELAEVKRVTSTVLDAWRYSMTPAGLLENIGEVDSQLVDLILDLRQYEQIGQSYRRWSEADRLRSVELSRYMEHFDVLVGLSVDMWTDFGFGQDVHIKPHDQRAAEVWEECWTAPRNRPLFAQDAIHHEFSRKTLVDGERFFVAYAAVDGSTTWRAFDTDQVKQIVRAPSDPMLRLFYIVEMDGVGQIAYPDAMAVFSFADYLDNVDLPVGVKRVNQMEQSLDSRTFACIVAAQRNLDRNGRGWPQFRKAFPWATETKENIENHAAVARLVATYVDKLDVTGGQRALDAIKSSMQSTLVNNDYYLDRNPPPVAGSTWLENQQVERTRMPLGTGASDAQTDSMVLLSMFAAGAKIPPHWLMRPDMMQNRAVSEAMAAPAVESWRRYQTFWSARFADILETTLRLREMMDRGVRFDSYAADIVMDSPLDLDADILSKSMGAVTDAAVNAVMDYGEATRFNAAVARMLLADFGVNDPESVLNPPIDTPAELAPLVKILMTARENYQAGRVDLEQYQEFLVMQLAELVNDSLGITGWRASE